MACSQLLNHCRLVIPSEHCLGLRTLYRTRISATEKASLPMELHTLTRLNPFMQFWGNAFLI